MHLQSFIMFVLILCRSTLMGLLLFAVLVVIMHKGGNHGGYVLKHGEVGGSATALSGSQIIFLGPQRSLRHKPGSRGVKLKPAADFVFFS